MVAHSFIGLQCCFRGGIQRAIDKDCGTPRSFLQHEINEATFGVEDGALDG